MNPAWLPTQKAHLLQFALDAAIRHHAELWDAWKVVEAKAQTTLTVGGVLIAGVAAYVTQSVSPHTLCEKLSLSVLLLVLIVSTAMGVAAILVKDTSSPHLGQAALEEVDQLIAKSLPDTWLDSYERLVRDTTQRWVQSNEEVESALNVKAARLAWSQKGLLGGLGWTVFVVGVTLAGK